MALREAIFHRNFHFACPATREYIPEYSTRHLFRIRSNGEDLVVPAGPLPRPKSHHLPDLESISQTPLPQLPSVVQIGFAFLLSLPGWQRQSLYLPQYASEQAPREMALCQQ